MAKDKLLPLCVAQLRGVAGSDAIIVALKDGKPYKCPCDDGAGTGTSTVNSVVYICDYCSGNGWVAKRAKKEQILQDGKLVYKISEA